MIIESAFKPHPLLANPHLQTIVASKLRRTARPVMQTERLELPDGDFVDIAWNTEQSGPLVCIFHGLQGNIDSAYASGILDRLYKEGFQLLFMHFRGCSGEPNRLASSYHSGHTDDIRFLITTAGRRFPAKAMYAVAYSLGANALLKYLGEEQDSTPLKKAVAVSPPLVLAEGADRLNKGLSRIYQAMLVRQMQNAIINKQQSYPELDLPDEVRRCKTFWEFDDKVTAPLHGFADVHDYYARASSRQWLSRIRIRTHILFARDDPFFTERVIPATNELAESVYVELSAHGGHVGFIGRGADGGLHYWLDQRISELLSGHSETTKRRKP